MGFPCGSLYKQIFNETILTLQNLKEVGRVRYIGITGIPLNIFTYVLNKVPPCFVDVIMSYFHYKIHDSLDVDENCISTEFESSLSSNCRYLGKVVDYMKTIIYDNCKCMCNTIVVNCFYAHGTIQSILINFEAMGHLLWIVPFMTQQGMEA